MARIVQLGKPFDIRPLSFCDCFFPKSTEVAAYKGNIHDLVTCKCGQEDTHPMEWIWDKDTAHPECFINGPDVTFHPIYSQGTSIIRGNRRLEPKMVHYWEMRIITSLSGTDVMFGIGTEKVNLSEYHFSFVSALGSNDQSWGFSFRGVKQHKGEVQTYGNKFSQGCIVGVYCDLVRGFLEFFINRRSLGVAYHNIPTDPSVNLYPMACSTAAKSSIRLINSTSQPDTLQFHAMKVVSKRPSLIAELKRMPGLKSLVDGFWFLAPPRAKQNLIPLEDEVVLPRKSRKNKFTGVNIISSDAGYCSAAPSITTN